MHGFIPQLRNKCSRRCAELSTRTTAYVALLLTTTARRVLKELLTNVAQYKFRLDFLYEITLNPVTNVAGKSRDKQ